VNHPHAKVHGSKWNSPQRGPRDVGRDQQHQSKKGPPMKPLELRQLKRTPLSQHGVAPRIRVKYIGMNRVDNSGASHCHIDEQECEQGDSKLDIGK